MVSVLPSRRISGSSASSPPAAITPPSPKARKKPVLAAQCAFSFSRAPRYRLTRLLPPVPIQKPSAESTEDMENTTPTAATATVPSCATKNVSAML